MEPQFTAIEYDDGFCFECGPDLPCFNQCCKNLNQLLTPYDILQLKHYLGLNSSEFLAQYTITSLGPSSGLPVISLKPCADQDRTCPFVTPAGCRVYPARPVSCRIYPLARAVRRDRATGRISEHFALLREPHCRGFECPTSWTVKRWITDQAIAPYNQTNDPLIELISLKNRTLPGPLDAVQQEHVCLALYDIDRYRQARAHEALPSLRQPLRELVSPTLADDTALLKEAIQWVGRILLAPTS